MRTVCAKRAEGGKEEEAPSLSVHIEETGGAGMLISVLTGTHTSTFRTEFVRWKQEIPAVLDVRCLVRPND